jgi:hypothetical protein
VGTVDRAAGPCVDQEGIDERQDPNARTENVDKSADYSAHVHFRWRSLKISQLNSPINMKLNAM